MGFPQQLMTHINITIVGDTTYKRSLLYHLVHQTCGCKFPSVLSSLWLRIADQHHTYRSNRTLKEQFRILDIRPHFSSGQCLLFETVCITSHLVLQVAEIAGARLAQVEGCASLPIKFYITQVHPRQTNYNARIWM